jgi:hypothetical protein
VPKGSHAFLKWNSHLELESLPTGGWGYDHFPLSPNTPPQPAWIFWA